MTASHRCERGVRPATTPRADAGRSPLPSPRPSPPQHVVTTKLQLSSALSLLLLAGWYSATLACF